MPRGIPVLKNPSMYSKKRLERALKHRQRKKANKFFDELEAKEPTTIEKLFADAEPKLKPNGPSIRDHCRSVLYFDAADNTYYINGLQIDVLNPKNAAEIVRRFNSGDA